MMFVRDRSQAVVRGTKNKFKDMMSQFKRDNSPSTKIRSLSRGLSQKGTGPNAVKNNMAPRPTLASEISSNTVNNLPRHNFRNENSNKKLKNPDINNHS